MGAQCLAQTLPKCSDLAHLFQLGSGINDRQGSGRHLHPDQRGDAPVAMIATPPEWVLDTNVVLDWLLFDDASMRGFAAQLEAGSAQWLCTAAMREEALEVVARDAFVRFGDPAARQQRIAAGYARHARECAPAVVAPLRCADPDDQMFVDLALAQRATLLLSRDKAVLALAPRALPCGLLIADPRATRR
jgi:predicted nucleic acid-binding protein